MNVLLEFDFLGHTILIQMYFFNFKEVTSFFKRLPAKLKRGGGS